MHDYYKIYIDVYNKYYPHLPHWDRRARALRCADHLRLVVDNMTNKNVKVCDIGGLFGDFVSGCAAIGMDATFIDDFHDSCHSDPSDPRFDIHKQYGVKAIKRDVIEEGIDFPDAAFDVFTCFGTMEHWHHSPKKLFAQIMRALKPRGLFILGVPNCVDVVKRITVPLGRASWSSMKHWYEQPVFRDHVREASLKDLSYIARDMSLRDVKLFGRNWNVYSTGHQLVRACAPALDWTLRWKPSLCLSIYMLGRKG